MSTIPRTNDAALDWCDEHATLWSADPAAVGLDATEVANMAALVQQAQDRKAAFDVARTAWLGASEAYSSGIESMLDDASVLLAKVRAFARGSAEPATVYQAAGIPAPADRSPRPAPGTPTDFKVELLQDGAITLSFKCPNPPRTGSTIYRVERRLESGQGEPFVFVVNAKERSFTDSGIPEGTGVATYRITAETATKNGAPALFAVRFGAGNQATIIALAGDGQTGQAA